MMATQDRSKASLKKQQRQARERFAKSRVAEKKYQRQLNKIARAIGDIVEAFAPDGVVTDQARLQQMLNAYSALLAPWAEKTGARMVAEVAVRNERDWAAHAQEMGLALRKEIKSAPTGKLMRALIEEQVILIKSLPIEAGRRVQKLSIEAYENSTRASEIAKEIMRTRHVTSSRAKLIARTEVARVGSALTQARAVHVGSTQYEWVTVGDSDVREEHRKLNGRVFSWDDPPVTGSNGERSAPGAIYNCRCVAFPLIPNPEDI